MEAKQNWMRSISWIVSLDPFNCSPKLKIMHSSIFFVNGKIMKNWNTNRNGCLFHCSSNDEMNESHLSDAKNMHRSSKWDFVILNRAWQYTHFTSCESQHYTKILRLFVNKMVVPFFEAFKENYQKQKRKKTAHTSLEILKECLMLATFPIIHFTQLFL